MLGIDADCSGDQTLTNAFVDVPNCSVTFNTPVANCTCIVTGSAYCESTTVSGSTQIQVRCVVDGSAQTGFIQFLGLTSGERASCARAWTFVLSAAGSHTIKLQAEKDANVGTYKVLASQTGITAFAFNGN